MARGGASYRAEGRRNPACMKRSCQRHTGLRLAGLAHDLVRADAVRAQPGRSLARQTCLVSALRSRASAARRRRSAGLRVMEIPVRMGIVQILAGSGGRLLQSLRWCPTTGCQSSKTLTGTENGSFRRTVLRGWQFTGLQPKRSRSQITCEASFSPEDETITYLRGERTWVAVSGFKESRIFYRKAILACAGKAWHHIAFEYPAELKGRMDPFVVAAAAALDNTQSNCDQAASVRP